MMSTPIEDSPLLESFVKGDDAYRNSRFKLIPYFLRSVQFMLHCTHWLVFSFRLFSHYNLQLGVPSIFPCFWTSLACLIFSLVLFFSIPTDF